MQIVDSRGNCVDIGETKKPVKVTAGEVYKLRIVMERVGPGKVGRNENFQFSKFFYQN